MVTLEYPIWAWRATFLRKNHMLVCKCTKNLLFPSQSLPSIHTYVWRRPRRRRRRLGRTPCPCPPHYSHVCTTWQDYFSPRCIIPLTTYSLYYYRYCYYDDDYCRFWTPTNQPTHPPIHPSITTKSMACSNSSNLRDFTSVMISCIAEGHVLNWDIFYGL